MLCVVSYLGGCHVFFCVILSGVLCFVLCFIWGGVSYFVLFVISAFGQILLVVGFKGLTPAVYYKPIHLWHWNNVCSPLRYPYLESHELQNGGRKDT